VVSPSRGDLEQFVEEYLAECFARKTPPQVKELALKLGVSASGLSRMFSTIVGQPPSEYLKARQIERAKLLLRTTTLDIAAIGYEAGFGTEVSFHRAFRRATSRTPKQFRESR